MLNSLITSINHGRIIIFQKDILKHIYQNKNIQDYTVNATKLVNEIAVGSIENFNKSIELAQRYYNDILQNNFNYTRRIERSYNRQ